MNTKREKIEKNRETIKGKCQQMKWNESGFRPPLCTYRLNWARRTFWGWLRWLRWHCPPDTGFEIRALAVWGRARYLSVTEVPHNTDWKCQHDMLKHITRRFLRRSDRQTTSLTLTTGVYEACTKWRGASIMNIHYDVTGLLTVVWRSHSGQIVWPAGVGQGRGGF